MTDSSTKKQKKNLANSTQLAQIEMKKEKKNQDFNNGTSN